MKITLTTVSQLFQSMAILLQEIESFQIKQSLTSEPQTPPQLPIPEDNTSVS